MGCFKGGVVANVVIPTPDYVRFATHYGFRPDFCHAADPESKGIVEHLVGYAQRDIPVPDDGDVILAEWNAGRRGLVREVNAPCTSRRAPCRQCGSTPSGRCCGRCRVAATYRASDVRTVDKLSTVRVASVRYSVPFVSSAATSSRHLRRPVHLRLRRRAGRAAPAARRW